MWDIQLEKPAARSCYSVHSRHGWNSAICERRAVGCVVRIAGILVCQLRCRKRAAARYRVVSNLSNPSSHLGQSRACPLRCNRRTETSDSQPRLSRLNFQGYSRLNARFSFSCARAVCVSLRRDRAYSLLCRLSGQWRSWVARLLLPCALLSCASFGRLDCLPSLVPRRSNNCYQ